jgi:hypothetical protein
MRPKCIRPIKNKSGFSWPMLYTEPLYECAHQLHSITASVVTFSEGHILGDAVAEPCLRLCNLFQLRAHPWKNNTESVHTRPARYCLPLLFGISSTRHSVYRIYRIQTSTCFRYTECTQTVINTEPYRRTEGKTTLLWKRDDNSLLTGAHIIWLWVITNNIIPNIPTHSVYWIPIRYTECKCTRYIDFTVQYTDQWLSRIPYRAGLIPI